MSDVRSAERVAVLRQPGFLWVQPTWQLQAPDGSQLGTVVRAPGGGLVFGNHRTFLVADAAGGPVWMMRQFSTVRLSRFEVLDPAGALIGVIRQENAWLAPQFRLTLASGATGRLDGGRNSSWQWRVLDAEGGVLAMMIRESRGLADAVARAKTYTVQRVGGADPGWWPLVVLCPLAYDIVHERKQRSSGSPATP